MKQSNILSLAEQRGVEGHAKLWRVTASSHRAHCAILNAITRSRYQARPLFSQAQVYPGTASAFTHAAGVTYIFNVRGE